MNHILPLWSALLYVRIRFYPHFCCVEIYLHPMVVLMFGWLSINWGFFTTEILLVLVMVLTVCVYVLMKYNKGARGENKMLYGALQTPFYGVIFFNRDGVIDFANQKVRDFFPDLFKGVRSVQIQDEVLQYFFDHAVECD